MDDSLRDIEPATLSCDELRDIHRRPIVVRLSPFSSSLFISSGLHNASFDVMRVTQGRCHVGDVTAENTFPHAHFPDLIFALPGYIEMK